VGLTVDKLGDGAVSNCFLTGVQPWWVGEGVGLWGATVRQPNVGGYGAVRRVGGATHWLRLVAPGLHSCTYGSFTKVRRHGAH
jgi:hypothetical protein